MANPARAATLLKLLKSPGSRSQDEVLAEVAALTHNWAIIDSRRFEARDRINLAYVSLNEYLQQATRSFSMGAKSTPDYKASTTAISKNLIPVVEGPGKYGLANEDIATISESLYHLTGREELDPSKNMTAADRMKATHEALTELAKEKHDYTQGPVEIEALKTNLMQIGTIKVQTKDVEKSEEHARGLIDSLKEKNQGLREKQESLFSQAAKLAESRSEHKASIAAVSGRIQQYANQIGASLAKAIPYVGPVLGFIVGKVIGRAIAWLGSTAYGFLVRNKKAVDAAAAGGAILGGLALGGPVGLIIAVGGLFLSGNTWVKGAILGGIAFLAAILAAVVSSMIFFSLAAFFGIVGFVAFLLLIITNAAYVTPPTSTVLEPCPGASPGASTAPISPGQTNSQSENIPLGGAPCVPIGDVPISCPGIWPVDTSRGQVYPITQGPTTTYTHKGLQAVDLARGRTRAADAIILSTHEGIVVRKGIDGWGGQFMFIEGACNNQLFATNHVHFSQMSSSVNVGTQVTRGTVLGVMGMTGKASGPHEHYEFLGVRARTTRGGAIYKTYTFGNPPIPMAVPYIPKAVPVGCLNAGGAGGCNMSAP